MSRGPGRVQRAVLDYLDTDPGGLIVGCVPPTVSLLELARAVHQVDEPTDSQVSSVRRAVRTLARVGKVRTWRSAEGNRGEERYYRARRGDWIVSVPVTETVVQRAMTQTERVKHRDYLISAGRTDRADKLYPDLGVEA